MNIITITVNGTEAVTPATFNGELILSDIIDSIESEGFGHELSKCLATLTKCLNNGYPAVYLGTNFDAYIETGE